ncbi:MAG: type pili twitching motility protein PilT [Microbacteriaceae bacterium]|jgi:twitching motility protein PilT|nr:type pili twitching motility protein PilT [Microbacteriaceae bacterium]
MSNPASEKPFDNGHNEPRRAGRRAAIPDATHRFTLNDITPPPLPPTTPSSELLQTSNYAESQFPEVRLDPAAFAAPAVIVTSSKDISRVISESDQGRGAPVPVDEASPVNPHRTPLYDLQVPTEPSTQPRAAGFTTDEPAFDPSAYPPPATSSFPPPPAPLEDSEKVLRTDLNEVEAASSFSLDIPTNERAPSPGSGQHGSDPRIVASLNSVVMAGASDLHLTAAAPPMIRVDGALRAIGDEPAWESDDLKSALYSILSSGQREIFEEKLELDFAYTLSETARFRVNIYQQRQAVGAAFRLIPTEIKSLVELGIPEAVAQFSTLPRGLVLVTGPTGSGKSTTLAALIDLVNRTRADHIVTVEDPIEFIHGNHMSLVNQREVGQDTHSFNNALKHVLRQDPDVILVGELRDLETISVALTAAETGHLVFATLHTQDAAQTVDRVIDVFPPYQQGQVRAQLAATLRGVVCQTLVKRASGRGRVVATEIMLTTPAVANLIREGKTYQIETAMQAGGALGMQTLDQHLAELVNSEVITYEAALDKAKDVDALGRLVNRKDTSRGAPAAFSVSAEPQMDTSMGYRR